MYKVVIADDELFSRNFLEQCINNLTTGFLVVGKFASGKEVIEYIEKNDADIILTDIKMPEVSGLEIAKYVYENKLGIKIVLVSGFQEFEYARQAMKYNIQHYLVKVIDTDEFIEVMNKLKEELDLVNTEPEMGGEDVETEMFLYDIFCGMYKDNEEIKERYKNLELSVPFEKAECEILSVEFDGMREFLDNKWNYDVDIFRKTVSNVVSIIFNKCFVMMIKFDFESCVFVILTEENSEQVENSRIEYEIFDIFGLKARIKERKRKKLLTLKEENDNVLSGEKDAIIALSETYSKETCVNEAINYINKNYNKGISRIDVANHVSLNSVYFGEMFKKITGKTVSAYLLDLRMSKAVEMLKNGEKTEFICMQVGYKDVRNFRRVFRKYTGYTFDEYRKNI